MPVSMNWRSELHAGRQTKSRHATPAADVERANEVQDFRLLRRPGFEQDDRLGIVGKKRRDLVHRRVRLNSIAFRFECAEERFVLCERVSDQANASYEGRGRGPTVGWDILSSKPGRRQAAGQNPEARTNWHLAIIAFGARIDSSVAGNDATPWGIRSNERRTNPSIFARPEPTRLCAAGPLGGSRRPLRRRRRLRRLGCARREPCTENPQNTFQAAAISNLRAIRPGIPL